MVVNVEVVMVVIECWRFERRERATKIEKAQTKEEADPNFGYFVMT